MVTLDLESLNIEELATLRDSVIEKLAEKVAARQAELESELEKLNLYGNKPVKKAQSAPVAKSKKDDTAKEPVGRRFYLLGGSRIPLPYLRISQTRRCRSAAWVTSPARATSLSNSTA